MTLRRQGIVSVWLGAMLAFCGARAEPVSTTDVQALMEQNRKLQAELSAQARQIEGLRQRLEQLESTPARAAEEQAEDVRTQQGGPEVRISGTAAAGYFRTGEDGAFPNGEFRADDARLFVEARAWKDVYLFGELDLMTREQNDKGVQVGELYLEWEDVLAEAGWRGAMTLRIGRVDIPFGEEYQRRDPVTNPLISHSLADFWGVDEGVEIFGKAAGTSYVLAVQNGGRPSWGDGNADKAVTLRIGRRLLPWLDLSGSAMRTGALSVADDGLSELWFGGGFIRPLGPAATTTEFSANLWQLDARAHWRGGEIRAAGGEVNFKDNDTAGAHRRRMSFWSLEGRQDLAAGFYGAARVSEIRAPDGYPLAGFGALGSYFFNGLKTRELWRATAGLGYRFARPLVWKIEYGIERGELASGAARDNETFLSSELAMMF